MTQNNGRPLPWHDTATCDKPGCGGPTVPFLTKDGGHISCAICGKSRKGNPEDVAKTWASHRAWEMLEEGTIHADRGCARCNGPLLLDRERLCAPCVAQDVAERQASLFP